MDKLTLEHLAPYKNKSIEWMEGEEWKYHPLYSSVAVSSLGRISSKDKIVAHNYGNTAVKKGKILSQSITSKGYLNCGITHDGKTKTMRVHRLVAETFIPNPDNKPQVNHIDGNKLNNSVSNLEWNTSTENVRHAWKTGLQKEKTDELVKTIVGQIKNYIDHRIKVQTPIGIGEVQIDDTCFRIIYENGKIENLVKSIRTWRNDFKLVVKNLSDLTKDIEHNGERFIPINKLKHLYGWDYLWYEVLGEIINFNVHKLKYACLKLLLEWHFDVFGLIAAGLAVDMNTLEGGSSNGN